MEDLIARTEAFSCADNRLELTPNKSSLRISELSLVGKIISSKNFISVVVKEIVEKAWKPSTPIQVKKVETNTFLFTFGHEVDRQLAFNRRPWTIKGAHLVLKPWTPELLWHEIDFSCSTFWVQVHGLPLLWQNKENLTRIGSQVGKVIDVDLSGDPKIQWKKFVRVQVDVNITLPLNSGSSLPRPGLSDIWVGIKFEKLPDLCYKCGIIGHPEKDCNLPRFFSLKSIWY
jgi:hypothetical protein